MSLRERPGSSSNQDRREPRYHVYVRLPFNRGDFVDPPPVSWDDRKSEALWTIISGVSQTEIDWHELAVQFDVTVEFLLQMVSYLTERHTAQLRAQMRKAAASGRGSAAPSPIPGGEPVGYAEGVRRAGSIGGRTSALSMRKEALAPKDDVNTPGIPTAKTSSNPLRPAISRNSSQTTLIPGQNSSLAAAPPTTASNKIASRLSDPQRRRISLLSINTKDASSGDAIHDTDDNRSYRPPESPSPVASTSPSSSSDSDYAEQMQSRYIRRPPRFQSAVQNKASDDDDDELAFLPPTRTRQHQHLKQQQREQQQQQQQHQQQHQPKFQQGHNNSNPTGSTSTSDGSGALDLYATVTKLPLNYRDHQPSPRNRIGSSGSQNQQQQVGHGHSLSSTKNHPQLSTIQSQTSDSSTSSAAIIPSNPRRLPSGELRLGAGGAGGAAGAPGAKLPGPLSPRRIDMLSREGSEGAPSMGSSFSDLDDASVTQSALEEALASRMQDGTIGSRMSMIGHTIRSKYLPSKGNRP